MKDICGLSAEISGTAMVIKGLSNQLDNNETETLLPTAMNEALFGISEYLLRIAADLDNIETDYYKKKTT